VDITAELIDENSGAMGLTFSSPHFSPPPAIHESKIFGFAPKRVRLEPRERGAKSKPEAKASSSRRWYLLLRMYDLNTIPQETNNRRNRVARKVTLKRW